MKDALWTVLYLSSLRRFPPAHKYIFNKAVNECDYETASPNSLRRKGFKDCYRWRTYPLCYIIHKSSDSIHTSTGTQDILAGNCVYLHI